MPRSYTVYPCTNSEQLLQTVLQSRRSGAQGLQLDLERSQFVRPPRLLLQNNALGEWFKVCVARHQGLSLGLELGHSKEVLEHYLSYFFPRLQVRQMGSSSPQPNWIHADIVSLILFHLLESCRFAILEKYLPKALLQTLELLRARDLGREVQERHIWGFAQNLAQLFVAYDGYRAELRQALQNPPAEKDVLFEDRTKRDTEPEELENTLQAESWQRRLWHRVQRLTQDGFCWHGELIGQVLAQGLLPRDQNGQSLQPESLYIIGSGFLSAQQLSFYIYLSQFTEVKHFWLTPALLPPELREYAARLLQNGKPLGHTTDELGNLPQSLWLENSLHSAALLSRDARVQWQDSAPPQTAAKLSLLDYVRRQLRDCVELQEPPELKKEASHGAEVQLHDESILFLACSDKRREVEVLKDHILASLDANSDWSLNDIAILAPDINEYQALIQSIFLKSGGDYRLDCNFIDLSAKGGGLQRSGVAASLSEYFAAFEMLLGLGQSALQNTGQNTGQSVSSSAGTDSIAQPAGIFPFSFALDECLRYLENPCVQMSQLLQSKPNGFWRKVLRHWKSNWGLQSQKARPGSNDAAWPGVLRQFVRDYLGGWSQAMEIDDGPLGGTGLAGLCQQLSLGQDDAELLAALLQNILRLHERLASLPQRATISEWVALLESLQDEFLLCRAEAHYSDCSDRRSIDTSLRNLLAIEDSLSRGLGAKQNGAKYKGKSWRQINFPFSVLQELLRQKLAQNFSFKGRYLTQGINCASLQPYRSVPFRMICVLGFNERSFPRSSTPLRFDLCARLPQHLSRESQEQHIFAELLLSARERLLFSYQNRDLSSGSVCNPSSSLHDLCHFIARQTQREEGEVWRALHREQPLFPFARDYFVSTPAAPGLFTYSRSAYEQYRALERSYRPAKRRGPVTISTNHSMSLLRCDIRELELFLCDAPTYFWQHYSGLAPVNSWAERSLSESFFQGEQLSAECLVPMKYAKWQRELWNDVDYFLQLSRFCALNLADGAKLVTAAEPEMPGAEGLREFLRSEGLLGAELFRQEQWQNLFGGLQSLVQQLQKKLIDPGLWPGWPAFWRKPQYSILLRETTQVSAELTEQLPEEFMGRMLGSEGPGRHAAYSLPALRMELDIGRGAGANNSALALVNGEAFALWWEGESLLCWNQIRYGVPAKLHGLLQKKLFSDLRQSFPQYFGRLTKLLQLDWDLQGGVTLDSFVLGEANGHAAGNLSSLRDYIWLLWRGRCEALPLSGGFLAQLKQAKDFAVQLAEFACIKDLAMQESFCHRLQAALCEQWQEYLQDLLKAEWNLAKGNYKHMKSEEDLEAWEHVSVNFDCLTLRQPRFWLLLHELLQVA